jgi:hypothetical protein
LLILSSISPHSLHEALLKAGCNDESKKLLWAGYIYIIIKLDYGIVLFLYAKERLTSDQGRASVG